MIPSLNWQAFFADSLGISILQTPNHQPWLYIHIVQYCNCYHELLLRRQDPGNLWWLCGQTVTSQQSEPFRRIRTWRAASSLSFTFHPKYISTKRLTDFCNSYHTKDIDIHLNSLRPQDMPSHYYAEVAWENRFIKGGTVGESWGARSTQGARHLLV